MYAETGVNEIFKENLKIDNKQTINRYTPELQALSIEVMNLYSKNKATSGNVDDR